jgi:ABC-type Mn2+/Zn2+ transport system ATPase subunit
MVSPYAARPTLPPIVLHAADHHIIRLRDVTVHHGRVTALHAVTADLPCGRATAICGPNGAGKSTLLRSLLGWHVLDSGEIRIGDAHPRHALPRLAYLPQRQTIDWDFPLHVRAVVEQGRLPALGLFRRFTPADHARVAEAMAELDLTALADRPLHALSGGQQQRVFLARALAQGADIFLLDEPFAGLDLRATGELLRLIRAWVARGRTVLAVVHDLALARQNFDHALLLDTDLIASGRPEQSLTDDAVRRAYHLPSAADEALQSLRTVSFPS